MAPPRAGCERGEGERDQPLVFEMPRWLRWMQVGMVGVLGVLPVVAWVAAALGGRQQDGRLLFVGGMVLLLAVILGWGTVDRVVVGAAGVEFTDALGRHTTVPWDRVARVWRGEKFGADAIPLRVARVYTTDGRYREVQGTIPGFDAFVRALRFRGVPLDTTPLPFWRKAGF